jgi:DNA-binding NtrC family response regulator
LISLSVFSTRIIRRENVTPRTWGSPTELFAPRNEEHKMSGAEKKHRTILHFGTDRVVLLWRAHGLNQMGYRVLSASNGFEAIKLATFERVDAVVLDLDRNSAEVALVATEIKRCRPQLPTILLTEGAVAVDGARAPADALVPKRDDLEMLVTALENVLAVSGEPPKVA